MKQKHILIAALFVAVALCAALVPAENSSSKSNRATDTKQDSIDLLEVTMPDGTPDVECLYEGFTVHFNPGKHLANFAAWEVSPEKVSCETTSRRHARFAADPDVEGCATLDDYRNSGYDRGHLAPAADMKWSVGAMHDCHYLTNIVPQDNSVNAGAWANVEKNTRNWAQRYGNLYIVAGPVLSDRLIRHIGDTPVPVPERLFKVIIAPNADPPQGIAFLMPNHPFKGGSQATVTSIDEIELITGMDFFHNLPDGIENIVESQHSIAVWNH